MLDVHKTLIPPKDSIHPDARYFVPLCAFPLASERLERGCGVLKMQARSEHPWYIVAQLLHITQLNRIMISCPWMLSQLPP